MASRRDQLHSYQFMLQRVISALVIRETDPPQSPLRRGVGAVFAGVMIAVIVAAGFGVYGILTKSGSDKWKSKNAVVVEKETGATYVYRDGRLHPTLNYTSALLISGQGPGSTFEESTNSLQGTPRGVMLGIPNAPDSLPPGTTADQGPWTMCSIPDTDAAGNATTATRLVLGQGVSGGTRLRSQGLLVTDGSGGSGGDVFLVWHRHRYRIEEADTVVPTLFGAGTRPVSVGTGWLNGLPAGLPIGTIDVPHRGDPASALSDYTVGDVLFAHTGTGIQYYLVLDDGLASISRLDEKIVSGQFTITPKEISPAEANSAPKSTALQSSRDQAVEPPGQVPRLIAADPKDTVCAETSDAHQAPDIVIGGKLPSGGTSTSKQSDKGTALADEVVAPPGRVVIAEVMGSTKATHGPYNIITDIGVRYPVPSVKVLSSLGYTTDQAVQVPANLVSLIPAGPTLAPSAALRPVPVGPSGKTSGR